MISTKSINVLILTIVIVALTVENANASYKKCIDQITSLEKINIDSTGKEVFVYIYEEFKYPEPEQSVNIPILIEYIGYVYQSAVDAIGNEMNSMILSPIDWCSLSMQNSIQIETSPVDIISACKKILESTHLKPYGPTENNLRISYYMLKNRIETTNNGEFIQYQYYNALKMRVLQIVNFSDVLSPRAYCHKHHGGNILKRQLRKFQNPINNQDLNI